MKAILASAHIRIGVLGVQLGLILVVTWNALATGTVWFGYTFRPSIPVVSVKLPAHQRARPPPDLAVNLPLLLLGVLPLWRRRLWAPLLAIAPLGA
jgi:hypothetical protein